MQTSFGETNPPGGYSHTKAIRGRAANQGMVFRLSSDKQGLKINDFRRIFINTVPKISHFDEKMSGI